MNLVQIKERMTGKALIANRVLHKIPENVLATIKNGDIKTEIIGIESLENGLRKIGNVGKKLLKNPIIKDGLKSLNMAVNILKPIENNIKGITPISVNTQLGICGIGLGLKNLKPYTKDMIQNGFLNVMNLNVFIVVLKLLKSIMSSHLHVAGVMHSIILSLAVCGVTDLNLINCYVNGVDLNV